MTEMYLPNPNNAVVHALRKTRMRVRHSRPLFIEGECIASTYITRRQKNGLNTTMSTTANATTARKTYPAVPKLAELAEIKTEKNRKKEINERINIKIEIKK